MNHKKPPHDDVSDAFLDSIFSNSPEAIVMLDHKNRVIRTNREFDLLFGFSESEIVGEHIDTLIAGKKEQEEAGGYSKMAERGERFSAESVRRRKDGSPVDVSIMGAPVTKDGEVIGIYGIYRDISERKEMERKLAASEANYRELFENAPIGIFQSSSDGRLLRANKATADVLGYASPEEICSYLNDLSRQLYYREEKRGELLRDLKEHGFLQNYEIEAVKKDGTILWLNINCRISRRLEDGTFVIDGFMSDKTVLKQAEQQIRKSLVEKEVLLQEVHHRVKNNMQIVSSLLNLELLGSEDEVIREMIFVIQKRIQTMALVHEKLYSSENVASVELGDYIRDLTMQIIDVMADGVAIEADFELETIHAGIDFAVPFGLVVNELVMNAYKHAFKGITEPRIFIKLERDRDRLSLFLKDNGIGLPEDMVYEESKTLGMKLIYSLAAQLDGSVQFRNDHGTRCRVVFSFPSQ